MMLCAAIHTTALVAVNLGMNNPGRAGLQSACKLLEMDQLVEFEFAFNATGSPGMALLDAAVDEDPEGPLRAVSGGGVQSRAVWRGSAPV
jgi:hypothetical protein